MESGPEAIGNAVIFGLLQIVSRAFRILPARIRLALGDAIGLFWFHVLRFRRGVVLENLTIAFGESLTLRQRVDLASRNYRHYGRNLMEILASLSWTRADYVRHLRVEGMEHIEPYRTSGRGGVLLASHLGNWELCIAAGSARGVPIDVIVKRAKNPTAERFLRAFRSRSGAGFLIEEGTARDILRSFAKGRFVAFVLDQFMGPPIGLPVRFFGHEAGTAAGLALLVDGRDIPIFPVFSYRAPDGGLTAVVEKPLEFSQLPGTREERLFRMTQAFNDTIESQVRRHPEQWLWLHRRWKAYRGEPRWKLAPTAMLLGLLIGCAGTDVAQTGIALPQEPAVAAVPAVTTQSTPAPEPHPTQAQEPVSTKKKKPKPVVVATPAPALEPRRVEAKKVESMPFEVGERAEYELSWMALPAGRMITEVRKGEPFLGRPTFHFWGNLTSSRMVNTIYKLENTAESFVDAETLIPYKFLLHMVESKQLKETRVVFDHPKRKAHYWAKRLSKDWGDEFADRVDDIQPLVRDMFTAFFYTRSLEFELGKSQSFKVYENGKTFDVTLKPVANEIQRTPAGAFQCWKTMADVRVDNVLKPTGDVFAWLSDDSKKHLVRFEAKIKIGSIYGVLQNVKER